MPSVTVIWPDKKYEVTISADESEAEWKFPRKKTPKNFALLMEFSPNIFNRGQNYSHLMFTSFTIGNGFLRVKFLEKLVIFFLPEDVTITIRNIKAEDRYPDLLNSIPASGNLYLNIFLGEDEGDFKYVSTINGKASTLKTDCKKFLRKLKLEPLDYMISLLDADTPRYSLLFRAGVLTAQYKAVMNVALKPTEAIKFHIGEELKIVRYLPNLPKQHMIWALNHLDSGTEMQKSSKRRLLQISCNSGIPVDMLSGINGLGLRPDQFQRVCLPLNRWQELIEFVLGLNMIPIHYARHDLNQDLSEADLRLQVWDRLLLSIVSEYKCLKSEFDLKKFINSKNSVIVDLALVSRSGKFPVLIFEISARWPSVGFPHKDFVKMISSMSRLCMDQAKELESRGKDPLQAKVFGVWMGGTSFQFCVATPEKRYNSAIEMDELFINISFNAHWNFDLVKPHILSSVDCPSSCCNQSEMRVIVKKASVAYSFPEQSLNADATLNVPEQEEIEPPTSLPKRKSKIPDEHEFNLKDVCILKLFIECAEEHMQTIDSLLNLPKIDPEHEVIAINQSDAIITKSSSTSEKPTPKKLRATFTPGTNNAASANAREMISELFYHGNGNKIVMKKVPTQEIDVYEAIPGLFKPYFPTLWDFYEERNEYGKEAHVFVLERMEPFILEKGGYNAFFRAETFEQVILEAATMAVHVLFGLLILHEKAGYVHGDVSPNNIMFSPQFGIWKLIDFDHSLQVEESMNRSRRSGTDGYRAPESVETDIYSPSSDVCSFGMVLEKCICPFLSQHMKTGQQTHDLWEFKDLVSQLTRKDPKERLTVRAALDKFMKFVYSRPIPDFSIYGSTLLFPVAKDQLNSLPRATECPHPLEEEIPFSKITTN